MENKAQQDVSRLLKVVIGLMVKLQPEEKKLPTIKTQIKLLNELGLRPIEIAEVLGKNQNYINKELVSIRKKGGENK